MAGTRQPQRCLIGMVSLFYVILVTAGNMMLDLNETLICLKFSYQLLNSRMEPYSVFQGRLVNFIACRLAS